MKSRTPNDFSAEMIIDIKEIGWRLLEQWKVVLLSSLFLMALFLGLMYTRNVKTAASQEQARKENQQITVQDVIDALPENERVSVSTVCRLTQEVKQLDSYVHTAPIMRIDPNNTKRLRVSWTGSVAKNDYSIAMPYMMEIQTKNCISAIINAGGEELDPQECMDLVYITFPRDEVDNIVCVDVFLTESMDAEAVQEELANQIKNATAKLQTEYGELLIKNYQSEIANVFDDRVYSKQIGTLNNLANLNNQINNLKNNFTDSQKAAFARIQNIDLQSEKTEQAITAPKTITKRNVMAGFVLGAIIYIGLYLLFIILSHSVISPDSLRKDSVRILGEWYDTNSKRNNFFKDAIVWEKHHQGKLDKEEAMIKAVDTISSICKHKDVKELLFASIAEQSKEQANYIQGIIDGLNSQNINVVLAVTQKKKIEFNEKILLTVDGVVLIVSDSKTKYKDLAAVVEQCGDYGKQIMGSIYLG